MRTESTPDDYKRPSALAYYILDGNEYGFYATLTLKAPLTEYTTVVVLNSMGEHMTQISAYMRQFAETLELDYDKIERHPDWVIN